jgi:hypothetical protein
MSAQQEIPANAGGADKPPAHTWGIYVYFAADVPNLEMQTAAWTTLQTIASVGSNDKVKITAMIDLPGRNTEYYLIPKAPDDAPKWEILPDRFLTNVNSASIDTVLDFFAWSHRNCPADNIALIFWGHGYALDDYDPRIPSGQQPARGNARSAEKNLPGQRGNELKLLYDATHKSVLSNGDFAQVLRDFTKSFNDRKPIQVLGLDCCNMAMAEVLAELQGVADYAVAAESGLPFQSWLSAPILKRFLDDPHESSRHFAVCAVKDFADSMPRSAETYVAISACNLGKLDVFEAAMRDFVNALMPAIEKHQNRRAIAQAWSGDVSFVPDGLIDLVTFCELLKKRIPKNAPTDNCGVPVLTDIEKAVIDAAEKVKAAVQGVPMPNGKTGNTGGVIDYEGIAPNLKGKRISLSTGLSIWFPPWIQFPGVRYVQIQQSKDYFFDGYSSTRFAKVTGWDSFLRKLFSLTQR